MNSILIVGAGITGATAARILAEKGYLVTVIDKRDHVAGNCFDYRTHSGHWIQPYGPHIYHTSHATVHSFLSRFTTFNDYIHRVRAYVDGDYIVLPVNLETLEQLFGQTFDEATARQHIEQIRAPIAEPQNSEEMVLSRMGDVIYEKLFRNYTIKQWGIHPIDLDPEITARIPIRFNRDDRYFTDRFQGIPSGGFTRMVENMLDHPGITVLLRTPYTTDMYRHYDRIIYTGRLDEFYGYSYGTLPYRSLTFEFEEHSLSFYQCHPVVNYPNRAEYTRISEFKHLYQQALPGTVICREYSRSDGEPYYPIPRPANRRLAEQYLLERDSKVLFAGRLGLYQYLNIDSAILSAIAISEQL